MDFHCRLFEPYKSIGLVSSIVPHLIRYIDQLNKIQIVTAVGRSFLVFNERLQLVETCVAHSSDITLLASDSKFLFTASESEVFAWKHGHRWKIKSYVSPEQGIISQMLVLGGQLVVIDQQNTMLCWDIASEQIMSSVSFGPNHRFIITSIIHPATYINKILLGSQQGTLQLWNIAKQKLIYQYESLGSSVTSLAQSPALHVVAIGHLSGLIVLKNLKQDVSLMKFLQEFGPVSSISFRTDDSATTPIMVSSSRQSGHLAIWNLNEKRLEQRMDNLHYDSITAVSFVAKQPFMVTNSNDNSLKIFTFDDLQTTGRLLFQREGHRSPPTRIRFYDDKFIISAGSDSTLRAFCIYSERLNRNLGLASLNRKLAKKKGVQHDTNVLMPIVDLAMESIRDKEWDNIVACHRNTPFVTTWSFNRMKMGQHKLIHERFKSHHHNLVHAECVALSPCGNFVIVGYSSGHLDRFNIQSGLHRCTYSLTEEHDSPAHQGPVRAVVCDAYSQMIVSGGADNSCRVWRFSGRSPNLLIGSLKVSDAVNRMCLHKDNQFVAISLDNFFVLVMDLETKKIVRSFKQHRNRITDLTFDNDCKRLFVASMDSLIYVWDMLSGQLVDLLATMTPCVSLSLSTSGEFLATTHVNDRAIYLWSNLSVYTKVTLRPIDVSQELDNLPVLCLPTIQSDEIDTECADQEDADAVITTTIELSDINLQYKSPEQISSDLITLSQLASCQWRNLLNLDLIRKRNKPKEVVEKPKTAPFFLPCIAGLNPKFDLAQPVNDSINVNQGTSENDKPAARLISPFAQSLHHYHRIGQLYNVFEQMKGFGPSKIDSEVRSLGPESTGTLDYALQFIDLIECMLKTNRDFELVNSYVAIFIRIHMDTIRKEKALLEGTQNVGRMIEERWQRLQSSFDRSICLVNFLRNALL